jgi:hypothetical protein
MFERPRFSSLYLGYVDPARPDAWKGHRSQMFVKKIKESGHSVVIFSENKSRAFFSLAGTDTIETVTTDLSRCVQEHIKRGAI